MSTTDATEFTGKRTLVTGGTRGIGEAIANRFLRGGATVLSLTFASSNRFPTLWHKS